MNRSRASVSGRIRKAAALDAVKLVVLAAECSRLAGGARPRPAVMAEIGELPLLWHILKHASEQGIHDFVIALGDQAGEVVSYLHDDAALAGAVSIDLVDTGSDVASAGRLRRLAGRFDGTFLLTGGSSLSDLDLGDLLEFHQSHGRLATVAAVRPPARFGVLGMVGDSIVDFAEKPEYSEGWISSSFFVLEPDALGYIASDSTFWEAEPLEHLARDGQLMAYKHASFWQALETLRDKQLLDELWQSGNPPWKTWR
jgi:glucose-1-phosphate cytidylyltransferase